MFFNAIWIYGALALLIFGMATRQTALTALATLLLLTAGVSWLWNRFALHAVGYRRRLSAGRVFRGETITVEFELTNRKLLPLAWIEAEDQVPERIEALDRRLAPSTNPTSRAMPYLTSLRPYERVAWTATLRCPHRGAFTLGPSQLRSGDIFGFFSRTRTIASRDLILVYPRVPPLPELGLAPRAIFGDRRAHRAALPDPLRTVGVRDYRPEDSFRHVHWKATARAGQPQVRVFEPTTSLQIGVFLNLDAEGQAWRAVDSEPLERAIEVAAAIAAGAAGERRPFGVYSNRLVGGSGQSLRVPPGSGPAQLARCLEGLAKLSAFATVDFPRHLRAETLSFPWGVTIVVVTATMAPALAATLEALRAAGHRLVLVATEPLVPPPVRGLTVWNAECGIRNAE